VIAPHVASLSPVPTTITLALSTLLCAITPMLFTRRVRRFLDDAQARTALQAWQLRQLLPSEVHQAAP
jgi:hypothetical protein